MQEKLIIWEPIKSYSNELHLVNILHENGLKIILEDEGGQTVTFHYDRYHNEPYILSQKLTRSRNESHNPNRKWWTLFKVTNSNYVRWYDSLPGPGTDLDPHIEHHIYICSEYTIDVMSTYEPKVTVIKK